MDLTVGLRPLYRLQVTAHRIAHAPLIRHVRPRPKPKAKPAAKRVTTRRVVRRSR